MRTIKAILFILFPFFAISQSCDCGQGVTLDAGAGFASYQWSNGANTQINNIDPLCPSNTGIFTVTVTDDCGNTATDVQSVSQCTPTVSINDAFYSGSAQICFLFAQATCCEGPASFEWTDPDGVVVSTSANMSTGQFTTCGEYCLTLISCNGCTDCSGQACIEIISEPGTPDCCDEGCEDCTNGTINFGPVSCNTPTTFSLSCGNLNTVPSWSVNNVFITQANTMTYTPTANGVYNVQAGFFDECNNSVQLNTSFTINDCPPACDCEIVSVNPEVSTCDIDIVVQGDDCDNYRLAVLKYYTSTNGSCSGPNCTFSSTNLPSLPNQVTYSQDVDNNSFCAGLGGTPSTDYRIFLQEVPTSGPCPNIVDNQCVTMPSCCDCTSAPTIDWVSGGLFLDNINCWDYIGSDQGCTIGDPPVTYTVNYNDMGCTSSISAIRIYGNSNCSGVSGFSYNINTSTIDMIEICGNITQLGSCGTNLSCDTTWEFTITNCFGSNTYSVAFAGG